VRSRRVECPGESRSIIGRRGDRNRSRGHVCLALVDPAAAHEANRDSRTRLARFGTDHHAGGSLVAAAREPGVEAAVVSA